MYFETSVIPQTIMRDEILGQVSNSNFTRYNGEYEVTPTFAEQILETKDKIMSENVTVHKIPRYDVANEAGGVTVYIATETEV